MKYLRLFIYSQVMILTSALVAGEPQKELKLSLSWGRQSEDATPFHVSFLADERPLILHHHEHYDGTGYPARIAGDRIPIGARILAAADALDTMFSARSYKGPYTIDRVQAELDNCTSRQFDPAVAGAALQWLDEAPDSFPLAAASGNA